MPPLASRSALQRMMAVRSMFGKFADTDLAGRKLFIVSRRMYSSLFPS